MSYLVLNYDFASPAIALNRVYYTANLTSTQLINLGWTCSTKCISLENGSTVFSYPPSPPSRNGQFISLQYASSIQQSINITSTGFYTLTFAYASRSGYPLNTMLIYFNGVFVDTINPMLSN